MCVCVVCLQAINQAKAEDAANGASDGAPVTRISNAQVVSAQNKAVTVTTLDLDASDTDEDQPPGSSSSSSAVVATRRPKKEHHHTSTVPHILPALLTTIMKPHQKIGVRFIWRHIYKVPRVCVYHVYSVTALSAHTLSSLTLGTRNPG